MRFLVALLLTSLVAPLASAQREYSSSWVFRLSTGLDHHLAGDLTTWQASEQAALVSRGIPLQVTDAFPAFPTFRAEAGRASARWNYRRYIRSEIGAEAGVSSTGGRLYYEDYSGAFTADRRVRRVLLGVYGEHEVASAGPVLVSGRVHLRASPTTTEYRREVRVGEEVVEGVDASFRSVSYSALPAVTAELDLSERFRARGHVGYEVSWGARVGEVDRDLPADARWGRGGPRVGWDGVRAGVGLAVRFGVRD